MKCRRLESLSVDDTPVGDSVVAVANNLPRLRALNVSRTGITDQGARQIVNRSLRSLDVSDTEVRAASIQHLEWLEELTASDSSWSDEDCEVIARMSGLTSLDLSNSSGVTDVGIASLARLSKLESLFLNGTSISDESLEALATLPSLAFLSVGGTVTDEGLERLQLRRPEIQY